MMVMVLSYYWCSSSCYCFTFDHKRQTSRFNNNKHKIKHSRLFLLIVKYYGFEYVKDESHKWKNTNRYIKTI